MEILKITMDNFASLSAGSAKEMWPHHPSDFWLFKELLSHSVYVLKEAEFLVTKVTRNYSEVQLHHFIYSRHVVISS